MEGMKDRLDETIKMIDMMTREGVFALSIDRVMGMLQFIKQGE